MATDDQSAAGRSEFATTHWSMVLAAGDRGRPDASRPWPNFAKRIGIRCTRTFAAALPTCMKHRILLRRSSSDLLEQRPFETADPERGRFRAFLLTACKRFLINEWHKGRAAKRGGGRRPLSLDFDSGESKLGLVAVDTVTAEQLYEQQWAVTLLEHVLDQLRAEYAAKDRLPHFEALKPFLAGSSQRAGYADAARALGISETTAKVAAHRMRKRYRELLRAEIAQTVERPEDVDDEIRDLFAVLGL